MSNLTNVVSLNGLRFDDDIHTDLARFAKKANRTLVQQVRHYVTEAVVAEREGVSTVAALADTVKQTQRELEGIKAQIDEIRSMVLHGKTEDIRNAKQKLAAMYRRYADTLDPKGAP